jgi:hypothetical protein
MIVVTGKDTGMPAYIFVKEIQEAKSMRDGPCSFTRVFLKDPKQGHDYFLDVTESRDEIGRRIKEERHIPGNGVKDVV